MQAGDREILITESRREQQRNERSPGQPEEPPYFLAADSTGHADRTGLVREPSRWVGKQLNAAELRQWTGLGLTWRESLPG